MGARILILTAHTGGGHDSVATALAQAFEPHRAAGVKVTIAAPLGNAIDTTYCWALNRAPGLWGACYRASDGELARRLGARLLAARHGAALAALIEAESPDLILSVHALCAQAVAALLPRLSRPIAHHCVVTDLVDIHHTWLAPGVEAYYAPTVQALLRLVRGGASGDRVLLTGLPVRRAFWSGATMAPLSDRETGGALQVLLMDGGRPGPALVRAARAALAMGLPLDLRLAWGTSSPVTVRDGATPAGVTLRHLPAHASIAAEMAQADVVVTKAGSVTIAEALAIGLPIVLHRVAPGQESGNPGYIEAMGAGLAACTPAALTTVLRRLAEEAGTRAALGARAAVLGRPQAAQSVAAHVLHTLGVSPARAANVG